MAYILEKIGNTYNLPKKYFTCDAKSDLDGISLVDVPIGSEAYCILEEESYILDSNKQWHKKKIGEDAQADLSQVDSTQADYVKGIIRKESLPEGYPYKEIGAPILDGTFEFVYSSGAGVYMHQIVYENFTIVSGRSYIIIWDGVTYQCVATTYSGLPTIGNLAIAGVGADTGEPFLFIDQGNGQKAIGTNNTAATHTVIVRGEIAYPIATEFLPEGYPYKSRGVVLSKTTVQIKAANKLVVLPFTINFIERSLYEVIWDGIAYEVVAANIQGATAIGNAALMNMGDDTGEPFVIASINGTTVLFAETAGSHTVSIIDETIHPMAAEFLPDSVKNAMSLIVSKAQMPGSALWNSVTYGNGKFVAVADSSDQAPYSEDGINWTSSTMPSSAQWNSVTYGNGKFVAVAYNSNKIVYSEDGINWASSTMPSSARWNFVTYVNGKFVAVAYGSDKTAYSEDGINWVSSTMPSSADWSSVTYGNGKFVAIASGSIQAAYSEDGINWSSSTMPSSAQWNSVTYGNGKFVAITRGSSTKAAYSEDGINWVSSTMPSSDLWEFVTYGNGKFVAIAYNSNKTAYSEDGINWVSSTMPSSDLWESVTYGNGKFVAITRGSIQSAYSEDGITWKTTFEYLSQNNSNITESVRSAIGIPSYSTANNGQFLRVIDGTPTWATIANAEGGTY